ncbi:hypothetical protein OA871_04505 [Paracoccaceae bacterium]|nr:hypothetical protein [Paracoccaceae bacterium]
MKWIIVFYQIIVALPEGEIIFSGLDLGKKFIKTESILSESYVSKNECERKLVRFKGKNKISEVDTFYSKNAKIVTDYEPLINNQRVVVNAFQCFQIK